MTEPFPKPCSCVHDCLRSNSLPMLKYMQSLRQELVCILNCIFFCNKKWKCSQFLKQSYKCPIVQTVLGGSRESFSFSCIVKKIFIFIFTISPVRWYCVRCTIVLLHNCALNQSYRTQFELQLWFFVANDRKSTIPAYLLLLYQNSFINYFFQVQIICCRSLFSAAE